MIPAWMRSLFGKSSTPARKPGRPARRPGFRPGVLELEDRLVPTTVATATEAALLNALLNTPAGGTVDFAPGLAGSTIDLNSQTPAASGSFFVINKNLTIDATALGAGGINLHRATAAASAFRIFEVTNNSTVTFKNLTFTNGAGAAGGALLVTSGSAIVSGSTFAGNASTVGGGAIENESGTQLTVTTSAFVNNQAANGGAIQANGTLTANFNRFAGNSLAPVSEVQTVTLTGAAMSGNFTLTGMGTTTTVTVGDSAATVESNLQAALTANNPSLAGSVSVSGSSGAAGGTYTITFTGPLANADVVQFTATPGTLAGGTVNTGTQTQGAGNEVQTLTFAGTTGGNFTISYGGPASASQSFATTTASALQTLVTSLVGVGNAVVAGTNAAGYRIFYSGALAGTNVAQVQVQGAGLTPANSANTATAANGGLQGRQIFATGAANVENNWWGVNAGPGPNDVVGATATDWLTLIATPATSAILVGQTTTFTASITGLHSGGTTPAANLVGLPAFPVPAAAIFGNPVNGTLSSSATQFVNGAATTSFTATAGGTGSVDATADGQTVTGNVTILAMLIVDNNNDVDDGNVSPGNLTLREAVRLANAAPGARTITIANTLANLTLTMTLGQFTLLNSITINGPASGNYGLNAGGASRVFLVDDGTATVQNDVLSNLTIMNGSATNGGGILNNENLTIHNCTISGNQATAGPGGGINSTGGSLSIDPTIINGNTATGNGGGMNVTTGTLTLSPGDQVTNNTSTGGNGGGLSISGDAILQVQGTALTPGNSVLFRGNTAPNSLAVGGKGNGGAISFEAGATGISTLQGAVIGGPNVADKNQAAAAGGGVFVAGGTVNLNTVPSVIQGNSAATGGGLAVAGGAVSDSTANITGNTATGDGGGIAMTSGTLTLASGIGVTGNSSTGGNGGGISVDGDATLNVNGTAGIGNAVAIGGNTALNTLASLGKGNGGGLSLAPTYTGVVTVQGAIVGGPNLADRNQAASNGGGIAVAGGTLQFNTVASTIQNNTANSGGGLSVAAGTATLASITVIGNLANNAIGSGGGIDVNGGTVTIDGSTVGGTTPGQPNTAAMGGGIAIRGGSVSFANNQNTVQGNTAVQFGGGIDVSGAYNGNLTSTVSLLLVDNSVTGINSHGGGLAVRAAAANVQLTGATINRNHANAIASGGGGVFAGVGALTLTASTIGATGNGNTAFVNGGGIEAVGGSLSLLSNATTPVLVQANVATTGNGGGLYIGDAFSVTITGNATQPVNFANNSATALSGGSGGAIMIDNTFTHAMTITSANVGGLGGNSALRGGGIAKLNVTALNITDSTFSGNSAIGLNALNDGGGALFLAGGNVAGNVTTSDPTIYNANVSATNGGAVNVLAGSFVVSAGDEFTNNQATLNGGAINYAGGTGHTINAGAGNFVIIANNTAGGSGGGINVDLPALANTLTVNTTIVGGVPTGAGNGQSTNVATRGNNATGANGGGINVAGGTVTMTTVTIGGAVADPGAGAISGNRSVGGNGGGLSVSGGAVTLTTSTVGSTVANATGNVANAGSGGGINVAGGTLAIDGTTIGAAPPLTATQGNTAQMNGGGIGWSGGALSFTGAASNVQLNHTNVGNGGGIDIIAGGNLSIVNDTTILTNSAAGNGGGIAHRGDGTLTLGVVTAGLSIVASNTATLNGGGVFVSGGPGVVGVLNVTGGTIGGAAAGNTATGSGGGIQVNAGSLAISGGAQILNNKATNGNGGGINILTANAASITNGTVNSNTAGGSGGGINLGSMFGVTLTLDRVVIGDTGVGNVAQVNGGGINVLGGSVTLNTVTNVTFANRITGNTATTGNGGGINIATPAGAVTFTGTQTVNGNVLQNEIGNNMAGGSGGGINLASGSFTITGASNFPGANPSANVVNSIQGNTAAGSGGGLNQSGGTLALSLVTFSANHANGGDGGGINFTGGTAGTLAVPLERVTVAGNTASNNGGGISNSGIALFLNNFTIAANSLSAAGGDGGGVALSGIASNTRIVNTTIANNTGNGTGGLRQTAGALTIGNTLVGKNVGTDIRLAAAPAELTPNLFQTFAGFAPVGTDITGQDPLLGSLGAFGSGTNTIPLLPGSPAIDAGTGATGNDQRNVPIVNAVKDIGAFESRGFTITGNNSFTTVVSTTFEQTTVPGTSSHAHATATVTAKGAGEPVSGGKVTFSANTAATGGTATFAGNPATINGAGVATSGDITANQFFGTYDPLASASGATTTDIGTLINRGVNAVQYIVAPSDTLSGAAIPTVTVQLLDQFNNPLAIDGRSVTLTFSYNAADIAPGFVPQLRQGPPNGPVVVGTNGGTFAVNSGNLNPGPNGNGIASFANLFINTTGRYTFAFTAARDSILPPALTPAITTTFNIRATQLTMTNVDATTRSGKQLNPVTVTAVGVDDSRDLFFTNTITLGFASAPAGGNFIMPTPPGGPVVVVPNPNATPPAFPNGGQVMIGGFALSRGGVYQLNASSTSLAQPISGVAPNTTKVNANRIVFVSAASAGSALANPTTGGNVMPPNSVRSSAQNAIVDPNKDVLGATVVGIDVLNLPADIAANVTLSVVTAKQFRDGMIVNIPPQSNVNPNGYKLDGTVTLNAPGSTATYDANNGHLTLNRWGDYVLQADAADGMGFASNSMLAGIVTVIARTITVQNAPVLVVGPFQIVTQAKDITGDIAQNYNGPSDPTVLTIADIAGRGNPGVTGTMGTTTTSTGSSVTARANPVRGVTTFNFNASRPVLVTIGAIDQFQYFIGSDGSITIDTLDPGRRRPRPLPPVINLRLRPR